MKNKRLLLIIAVTSGILFIGIPKAVFAAQQGEKVELAMGTPIRWVCPKTFNPNVAGLGLPQLKGIFHYLIYDPKPCKGNIDEGGNGKYESLLHGTFNHHPQIVLYKDKFIVTWTNHSRDENGPGQRMLAKVGTFNPERTEINWGGDETLVELAPPPVPVRRRRWTNDPETIDETYALGELKLINNRLYFIGRLVANHGWTDDIQYHGFPGKPIPTEHWRDGVNWEKGDIAGVNVFDIWWDVGLDFLQRWNVQGETLMPKSLLYKRSEYLSRVEVAPGRFKKVLSPLKPYRSARSFKQAPEDMREDILHGKPEQSVRKPKYAPDTTMLAADGKNGLAHWAEFKRPDGKWVVIRDNLINPGYYYAALKGSLDEYYPPAVRTNLYGHAMPVAGELPNGQPWIICNNQSREDMYITLSTDGIVFDKTWLLMHDDQKPDGGIGKGPGPQYFTAITVGENIWVVYSIAKERVGVTKLPIKNIITRNEDACNIERESNEQF
jgi:hypothetical protein